MMKKVLGLYPREGVNERVPHSAAFVAPRPAPVVAHCFFFGGSAGLCHHPDSPSGRYCGFGCLMLNQDFRDELTALAGASPKTRSRTKIGRSQTPAAP